MDQELRQLQREASSDPRILERLYNLAKRLGSRYALAFSGPQEPPAAPDYPRAWDAVLDSADPWGCGYKGFAKQIKSRAQRRMGKNICRDWEIYWA